jgi:hypothetical protein
MRQRKIYFAMTLTLVLLLSAFSLASAWPDLPPVKAFISGPGIEGQVQITDAHVLDVLRLGGIEDMDWGVIPEPKVSGEGYQIIRYFHDDEFRMGDLTYYPNAAGARSVVYFDDGGMMSGDPSPFHKKWLYTTSKGDRVLQSYLKQIGAIMPNYADTQLQSDESRAVVDTLPEKIAMGVPVTLGFTLPQQQLKSAPVSLHREGESHRIVLAASPMGKPGHYMFTFKFPEAGTWNWAVRASYNDPEIPMPSLDVVDPGASAAPVENKSIAPSDNTTPVQEVVTSEDAAMKSGIEPLTLVLALVAGLVGIVGISSVILMNRRK